jgi:hypothetical protein
MTDAALSPGSSPRGAMREGMSGLLFSRTFMGRPYLISPVADVLMAGGGALILLALFTWLMPIAQGRSVSPEAFARTAAIFATVSYFINYPHFMASYALLYGNLKERMAAYTPGQLGWWRYVNAAYVVPVALLVFFLYCIVAKRVDLLGWSVQVMFFFVGWHYVKQAYGVFVVLSGMKGIYYTRWQVIALKAHVYSLWLYTWFASGAVILEGMSPRPMNFHKITYDGLSLFKTAGLVELLWWPTVALAIAGWGAILWNWRETGKRPSVSGLLGYTSMYTLLAFVRLHPLFAYAAPAFHSLQYLLFVFAYKRGEFHLAGEEHAPLARDQRPPWYRMLSYFLMMCATGALFFDVLPVYFDTKTPMWGVPLIATPIFHLFINTHHYFIDSAIWRRENRQVSRYLFWRR